MNFDREHHPKVMPGALWMNQGFSTRDGDGLPDWVVSFRHCTVHYNLDQRWTLAERPRS
jgi:hypothetical protein